MSGLWLSGGLEAARGLPYSGLVERFFHVSAVVNRASILAYGLDWTRMGAAPGIAGSRSPEVEGVFLGRAEDAWMFAQRSAAGPVDVWVVDGVAEADLVGNGSGYYYLPGHIPPGQVALAADEDWQLPPPVVRRHGNR